jgi:hypothetical protein
MSSPAFTKPPRFNHVAMSLPADLLDADNRKLICDFYGEVFGWEEYPTMTEDRHRLVLGANRVDQFVFLIADDPPMTCPRLDHFGMGVASIEELDDLLARAKAYQVRDDRVDIVDKSAEEHPGLTLTSFYVRYLLPMMVEVQHWEWHR